MVDKILARPKSTPKVTIYDKPREVYLRDKQNRVYRHEFIGETSRSWLSGAVWALPRAYRYAKSDYFIATKAEFEQYQWVLHNRDKILSRLQYPERGYDIWAKIAELIGYVATPEVPR